MDDLTKSIDAAIASLDSSGFRRAAETVERASTELARLRAENDELRENNLGWLRANGPGGWVDDMRVANAKIHIDHERLENENDSLRAENERLKAAVKAANAQAEHFERQWYLMGDENEALRADAERYQWLAASCLSTGEHWSGRWSIVIEGPAPQSNDSEDDFDAAIDAAMAQGK